MLPCDFPLAWRLVHNGRRARSAFAIDHLPLREVWISEGTFEAKGA
jgi:hypothetical protein